MQFSALTLNMFLPKDDDPADDHRIIELAAEQAIWQAHLGFNPWFTDHHFRGPWHSNPMQFASYIAPQIPRDRYVGFGVLSIPFYHPVRLVESMNLLDQVTKGRALFGVGSGWQGIEPAGFAVDPEYHASGLAAEEMLDVMERLWSFKKGDPEYKFSIGKNAGTIERRIVPAPYSGTRPTIIRTASREAGLVRAAQNGWPAFLGIFGADLHGQMQVYRDVLEAANHPRHVVDNCLKWCSFDFLGVTIAKTDQEAEAREKLAQAEMMQIRTAYVERHGRLDGPVVRPVAGKSTADAYAKGGDLKGTVAGSPDTIAQKIRMLADAGVNHVHLRFIGEWDGETRWISQESAKLFASEVMPKFVNR